MKATGRRGDAATRREFLGRPVSLSPRPRVTSEWCWRKESNLHQTGFEPVASAGWATPANLKFRIANFQLRIELVAPDSTLAIRHSQFCGTGGGIRTLINWFLRPVPLPGWATPVHSRIEGRGWQIRSSILNLLSPSLSGGGRSRTCTGIHPAA